MRTVLTADRLIDGTGRPPLPRAALVIEDGRVEGIATGDDVDAALEGADRIDVAGGSILPGFVEMHTHMHCSAGVDPLTDLATDSHEALLLRSARAMRLARSHPPREGRRASDPSQVKVNWQPVRRADP